MSQSIIASRQVAATNTTALSGTSILAAQGTGTSLQIFSLFAHAATAATNQIIQFGQTTTGEAIGRANAASKGDELILSFPAGWRLQTNTALFIHMATAGSHYLTINYEVESRG